MKGGVAQGDGLPHQSADWFAMTFFEVRQLSNGRGVEDAAPYDMNGKCSAWGITDCRVAALLAMTFS